MTSRQMSTPRYAASPRYPNAARPNAAPRPMTNILVSHPRPAPQPTQDTGPDSAGDPSLWPASSLGAQKPGPSAAPVVAADPVTIAVLLAYQMARTAQSENT